MGNSVEMTPWFQSDVYPVRTGVYERKTHTEDTYYSYWNGEFWSLLANSVDQAMKYKKDRSFNQWLSWRGIFK